MALEEKFDLQLDEEGESLPSAKPNAASTLTSHVLLTPVEGCCMPPRVISIYRPRHETKGKRTLFADRRPADVRRGEDRHRPGRC